MNWRRPYGEQEEQILLLLVMKFLMSWCAGDFTPQLAGRGARSATPLPDINNGTLPVLFPKPSVVMLGYSCAGSQDRPRPYRR